MLYGTSTCIGVPKSRRESDRCMLVLYLNMDKIISKKLQLQKCMVQGICVIIKSEVCNGFCSYVSFPAYFPQQLCIHILN